MDPQLVSFTRELSGRAGHDHLSPSRITLRAALGRWHQFVVRWPVLPVGAEPFRGGGRQCQIWRRTWRENLFRSEEHTSELQSLMRSTYAVFCLKTKRKKKSRNPKTYSTH